MSPRSPTFGVLLCYYAVLTGLTMQSNCYTVRCVRRSCSDGICCSWIRGCAS
ncbi:hypothetical protein PR003_g24424 [Phytophthora rubi]|uniref:Uncharacterized protein n=1 Tax=Phytophthora rubi TaxID=129364 RepID=A0A6A3JK35_9STRA|nr:hypothetical protein PR002_g19658 [Phytophthora rubi]KAE9002827.1 hypothetical protein PR001_g18143 [Phytophthora rubi]KAE9293772.1 hypothetical protein PR003_g24424 [Phytophthora rubi]